MTYTLQTLSTELQELQLPTFDYEIAWRLGSLMQAQAAGGALPAAITVTHGEDVVLSLLMPGATLDNSAWAARKRAVAHRFHRSSLAIRLEAEAGSFDFNKRYRLSDTDYVASGGGVPIILRAGTLIGTIGVSDLPDVEDHRLAASTLRKHLAAEP
ncbi:heme-degrading domain-containing protein [Agrobacterium larrymoorei]|uniref:Heme-binding protein n=1 Tax=Agrobacterium larrymoorei TaxID=160699 RepID=A0A4D7DVK7_9HYPH|nr:heme-binding protein [Agrobacterium larrymoorei]QCJ01112.1 hypothetical protein CFBP5473_24550 [Agrobacterium larrymoorei]QYA10125.1 heme-binding protein [Agrobacterium larrymoorei]